MSPALTPKVCFTILLIAFAFSADFKLHAQTHEPKFNLLPGVAGITFGKINDMVRDRHGVMWFIDQKNGLLRYDGTHITVYPHDIQNANSLGGPQPEALLIDSTGIIWISFWGSGLDRFDPKTGEFKHFRHVDNDPASVSNDSISAILIDHLGQFWVGTNRGLDVLDQQTGTFKHYRHNPEDSSSLSYDLVRTLYEDHEGTVWIGTGMAWDRHQRGGLNKFNRTKDNFTQYQSDPKDPHSLINNKIRAIYEDSRGTFWVGTGGEGLHSMDRKTGKFTRHLKVTNEYGDHITSITEDVEGQLWIGTWNNGVKRYNLATKEITYFGKGIGGLNDSQIWLGKCFSDGLFWLTTEERNLYQIDLFTNNIPLVKLNGAAGVHNFFQDEPGIVWIGTSGGGLIKQNLSNGSSQLFLHDPKNPKSISDNTVSSFLKDKKGNIWVGTETALNQFNPKTETFMRYQHKEDDKESIASSQIFQLCEDEESNIWIGTWGGGLNKFDPKTGKFTHYTNTQDTTSISGNFIAGILHDKAGELWVGSWNGGGLNRLNTANGKFRHYLKGRSVGQIYKDHSGVIWVCVANGLYRYNRNSDTFSLISNSSVSIEEARAITEDDESNLWVATPSGIVRIDKERSLFTKFNSYHGINQMIWYLSSFRTSEGKILFGTGGGYYAFDPSQLKTSLLTPKIRFTDFWISNESITAGADNNQQSIDSTEVIQLSHNQNIFSIGFAVTDYSLLDRKVLYSLEGYDLTWRQPSSEGRAYYFNVPPGQYTFTVKAVNASNGKWQQKQVVINISPPWWRTWWAYGSFGVLFMGLVFSVDRFQRNRLLKRAEEEAKEKELAQAKEIEKAYAELKATQSQLIQSEKMASLGELTAGIAHEIQNPLNFINNFSEVNSELIADMKEELLKGNVEEAKNIANDINENEKKIIFHGKRADGIVKGMLQHSRSSNGVKEPADINELCDEYLRLSYHGLRAKDKSFNAKFESHLDPTLPRVNVVPQEIGRVILNLINNAFYAVSEKQADGLAGYEPTVTVATKNLGDKVEIRVTDNGKGIPGALKDKIFQPFFTTKPAGKGTGLGLSLSYDIITKGHEGQIKVESREGEGTSFIIILPTK